MTQEQILEGLKDLVDLSRPGFYWEVAETLQDTVFIISLGGCVRYINSYGCKQIGLPLEKIIGGDIKHFFPPDEYKRLKISLEKVAQSGDSLYLENKFILQNKEIYLGSTYIPLKDERARVVAIMGISRDITQHKLITDELNFERQQLFSIFDGMDEAVYISDPNNHEILYANRALINKLGHPERSVLGEKCYRILQHLESPCSFCSNPHIFGENIGKSYIWEFQNRKTGHWHHCIDRAILWPDGRIVRCEIAINITERKIVEEALLESEEKYRHIVESSLDGIGLAQEGRVIYVNNSLCRIFGYSKEELLGEGLFKIVAPEDHPLIAERVHKRAQGISVPNYFIFRGLKKDGGRLAIEVSTSGEFIYKDKPTILSVFKDITERKRAEELLQKSYNELEVRVQERTRELAKTNEGLGNEIKEHKKSEEQIKLLKQQIEFILGVTKTGLDIIDSGFNIHYIDPEWAKVYGDPSGKKCYEYFMDRKERCPGCGIVKALETKKPALTEEVLPKENNRPILVFTMPFQDEKQEWLVAEVNVDIAERKKLEQALRVINSELEGRVAARTQDLVKINERLKQLVLKDPQTGLYNHRYLEEIVETELHRARRYGHPFSVMMLDVDYFKSINDVYGHHFGDLVLKQFARQLKKLVHRYDSVIRFGGEEFIVISPGINRNNTMLLAHRILDALHLYNFGNRRHPIKLKLSIAVTSYPEDKVNKGLGLVELAERIVARIKESGGNNVYSVQDIKVKELSVAEKGKENAQIRFLKKKINKLTRKTSQSLMEAVFAFAKTIEVKDHYTGEHVEMTVQYAVEIAKILNVHPDEVEQIRQAAMLHDLGKIGISEKILLKKSKLSPQEFEEIKKHPQIGVDILRPIQFLHDIIPLILYHHERWDGRGYPGGLKGEEIPLGARIVAIADVYQALGSDRPYRKAYSPEEVIRIIKEGSGRQFDPQIVNSLLRVINP